MMCTCIYPQRANIPLQGKDRHGPTVVVMSGPHWQIGAVHWCYFISHGFTWSEKHSGKAEQLTLASEHA